MIWQSWDNNPGENNTTDGLIQTWNGTIYVNEEKYVTTLLPNGGAESLTQAWDVPTSTWVDNNINLTTFANYMTKI